MPFRNTSMVPRLLISPCSRARNLRPVGPSSASPKVLGDHGMGVPQEDGELHQIDAVFAAIQSLFGLAGVRFGLLTVGQSSDISTISTTKIPQPAMMMIAAIARSPSP